MNELISKKLIENLYNKFCTSPSNYNSIEFDGKEYFIEDPAYSFIDGINPFFEKITELPAVQQNCDSKMEVKQNEND